MAKSENKNTVQLKIEVSPLLAAEIDVIRKNLGITITSFVRIELRKAIDAYPEKLKLDPNRLDSGPSVLPKRKVQP